MAQGLGKRLHGAAGVDAHLHRLYLGEKRQIEQKLLGGGGHVVDECQLARLAYHTGACPAPLTAAGGAAIEVESARREGGGIVGGAYLPECGTHGDAWGVGLECYGYTCRHTHLEVFRRSEARERCGVDAVVGVGRAWREVAHKCELRCLGVG